MRVTPEAPLIGVAAGCIDDCKADMRTRALGPRKQPIGGNANASNILFVPDLGIDRNQIVLSTGLHTVASEVNHDDRIVPYFRFQALDCALHVVARRVLNEVNVETVLTKCARQCACVVAGLCRRRISVRIVEISDHESNAIGIGVRRLFHFGRRTCAGGMGMRLLKSLHCAKAGRNKNYDGHGGQYHSPTSHLWPHTVLFRSVGSTITPTHIRSLFCGSKIETIETYSFPKANYGMNHPESSAARRDMHESWSGLRASASGLSRGKPAHRDIRTGTGASFSNVRVTPPNIISTGRAWL